MSAPDPAEVLVLRIYSEEWHALRDAEGRTALAVAAQYRTAERTGVPVRRVGEIVARWRSRLTLTPRRAA